ncbi:unnamed protein product [Haemonchus placei]|uniref:RNase H domain-containing protein n=1 Tax=Haemonchus placei TaxID=6290 RepID=A0A0N4VTJ3_HAEPC|nr:unnamed protein product [Haemonchus placei]
MKRKLKPLKEKGKHLTIPRLELLALLIGVRLTNFVFKEISLNIGNIRIYSDSQIALHWLQSQSKNGTFVDNRFKEIREKMDSWKDSGISVPLHHIPSELNPADYATRGLTKDQLREHVWWNGPAFLTLPYSKWPKLPEFKWSKNDMTEEDKEANPVTERVHLAYSKSPVAPVRKCVFFEQQYASFNQCRILGVGERENLTRAVPCVSLDLGGGDRFHDSSFLGGWLVSRRWVNLEGLLLVVRLNLLFPNFL